MNQQDLQKKIEAAYSLLQQESTTKEKFDSVHALLQGVNPHLDTVLRQSSIALSSLDKLEKGEIIQLTAEHLPDETEEQKKRKKALLFFIHTWNDLRREVDRVRNELEKVKDETTPDNQTNHILKIINNPKGTFGILTIAAVLIAGFLVYINYSDQTTPIPEPAKSISAKKPKIKVIIIDGKKIPVTTLRIGKGTECDNADHYHPLNQANVTSLDGSILGDPNPSGCGFGKVQNVPVVEISAE